MEEESGKVKVRVREIGRFYTAIFKVGGGDHKPRNTGGLKLGKGRNEFPLAPPERNTALI